MAVNVTGGPLNFVGSIDDSQFDSTINKMQRQINSLAKNVEKQGSGLDGFAQKAAVAAASYFSIATAENFIRQIIQVRGEFQQLDVAFTTILKSKEKADALMAQVVELAATTPFSLTEVATSAKQLLAYGFAAKDVQQTLSDLGNVAAGVSAPIGDIAYLYGTLRTQGRAYQKDIMQFTGRGIPIIAELAKQFKVSESQVTGLVEAGKVGFPQIEKAFQSMTGEGGIFFNLMQEQSKTLTGRISNLGDAFDKMLNSIGESNEGVLYAGIEGLNTLVENYQKVLELVEGLIVVYGSYRAALALNSVAIAYSATVTNAAGAATRAWTAAEIFQFGIWKLKEAALTRINALMLASPVAAFTGAIAGLTFAVYALNKATSAGAVAFESISEVQTDINVKYREQAGNIKDLVKAATDKTKSHQEQEKALKRLIAQNPKYLSALNSENVTTEKGKKIIGDYLKALDFKLKGEIAYAKRKQALEKIASIEGGDPDALGGVIDKAASGFQALFRGDITFNSKQEDQRLKIEALAAQQTIIKTLDKNYKEPLKAYIDGINNINEETKTPEGTPIDQKVLDKYAKLLDERKDLIKNLSDELSEVRRNGMSEEERDFSEIETRYQEQLLTIQELNRQLKKEDQISTKPLEQKRSLEIAQTSDKYAFDAFKKQLDTEKMLFENFEEYKTEFGDKKARERFAGQAVLEKTFLQSLEDERAKIVKENSYSKYLDGLIESERQSEQERNDDLLKQFETYVEERSLLQEQYAQSEAELIAKGELEKAKLAREQGIKAIEDLDNEHAETLKSYEYLFENIGKLSRERTIKAIEEFREQAIAAGLPVEAIELILAKFRELNDQEVTKKGSAELSQIVEDLSRIATEFQNINGSIAGITSLMLTAAKSYVQVTDGLDKFKAAETTAGKIGAGVGIIGAALGVVNAIAGYFKGLKKAKEEAKKALEDFQSMAIEGEREYQALLRQRDLDTVARGKNSYRAIIAQLELLKKQSPEIQKAFDKVYASLQGQSATTGVGYQHGTWLRKAKTWDIMASLAGSDYEKLQKLYTEGKLKDQAKKDFEALRALKEELEQAGLSVQDLQDQLNQMLTGTSTEGLASGLAELFENGKFAAEDFASSFEEIMANAIRNSFRLKVMEDAMQPFYEEFASLFVSGTPTEDQINSLKAKYQELGISLGNQFKELEKITGRSLTNKEAGEVGTGLRGGISGLTESTGTAIVGAFNGMRIVQLQTLDAVKEQAAMNKACFSLAQQNLHAVLSIERNTGRTADNTQTAIPLLDSIARNTKDTSATLLRAGGKYGY